MGEEIRQIVVEWVRYLREGKLWDDEDPVFPATCIALGKTREFEVAGLKRESLEQCFSDSLNIS